ncbi:MAG TPA: uroporphyrinogen-III C-methyltransferase [Candidatus Eisenbacteria bacterium]|nr:uroporphyrinogen-III C-methyltransferase [Candidatus Eisenbacteria bacterium]
MSGRVYLVGAGPGDPGLLTLRGQRHLAAADVVVHDDLVGRRLLVHARPDAEIVDVGRAHGDPGRLSQEAIGALLVDRARAGKTVVRLKNGDPFLFGRGAEEAALLRRAGIAFEVVPGVSSALAVPAYAGIPATDRDHASLVTIVTGHLACRPADGADAAAGLPWDALARQGGTLVFLMAMKHLPAIGAALVSHGLDPATPAAAIERGTTGRQRTVVATAATLASRVAEAGLRPPAVVVVGATVALREQVAWLEERPLVGRRILVTRPRAQAGELAALLEDLGAEVVVAPTIEIAPPADAAALDRAVVAASSYDWIVLTSVNGVRVLFDRLAALRRDVRELAGTRFAAIGPETAAELERHLVRPAVVPEDFRAEGLLDALGDADVRGRRVLLLRAAGARAILPDTLRARGAAVDEVIAYRAIVPPATDAAGLRAALVEGGLDVLTFTSSSTVRNFATLLGPEAIATLGLHGRPLVACIGPVTAETAREVGLRVDVVPASYTASALAHAIAAHFCKAGSDPLSGGVG